MTLTLRDFKPTRLPFAEPMVAHHTVRQDKENFFLSRIAYWLGVLRTDMMKSAREIRSSYPEIRQQARS
jgi:hypothetical protein